MRERGWAQQEAGGGEDSLRGRRRPHARHARHRAKVVFWQRGWGEQQPSLNPLFGLQENDERKRRMALLSKPQRGGHERCTLLREEKGP